MTGPQFARRTLLGWGAGAAALGGLAYAGVARAQAAHVVPATKTPATPLVDRPLRIGYLPITDASALLAAYDKGLLAKHGLPAQRPTLFRGWESVAQAFLADKLDVIHLLMPMAVQLRYAQRAPLKIMQWGHTNGSAITVAPDVTTLADLAGGQIAIPFWWSMHNVVLQRLLRAEGITPVVRRRPDAARGEVELVVMAPADMVAALDTGSVRAFAVADPFNTVAEVKQVGRIYRYLGDVWRDHACCVIAVHEGLATGQPAVAQALSNAITEAQLLVDQGRAENAAWLTGGKYLPQPAKAIGKVFTRGPEGASLVAEHPDWHGERLGFAGYPYESFTDELVREMRDTVIDGDSSFVTRLDPAAVHGDLFVPQFVTGALSSLAAAQGIAPGQGIVPASLTRIEEVLS
ncbi:ABC transporter substrate-binding protein [Micrococcales bacterium 31B]|nr:ABC transporter substrate-binding protein [Micrococcales bacterium 31B]